MSMAASQPRSKIPRLMVLMGVAGCGKSSVGPLLAKATGGEYLDGDLFHPQENIAKMSAGVPLEDADRWPWLEKIGEMLGAYQGRLIVGCSALKRRYRDRIVQIAGQAVVFVHLEGPRELIAARMAERDGHFMPISLLDSQFKALEPPAPEEAAVTVSIDQPMEELVEEILEKIRGKGR